MNNVETTEVIFSTPKYNMMMGLVLFWGFFINWLIVAFVDPATVLSVANGFVFLVLYSASCAYGYYLFVSSENPRTSFLGYNLVVLPLGFSLNLALHDIDPLILFYAFEISSLLTLLMMLFGYLFPSFFQKIYGVLAVSLLCVVIIEAIQIFVFGVHQEWIQWMMIALFCGYIGYDWGIANQVPKTLNNAIDSAAMIYIDIITLFLRIIKLLLLITQKKN